MIDNLDIDPRLLVQSGETGVFTYIQRDDQVQRRLEEVFGREGLCLKIFKEPVDCSLDEFRWGNGNLLVTCTKIQNIFALHDFAPRVYAIVWLSTINQYAQVTDYLHSSERGECDCGPIIRRHGIRVNWDMNAANWRGNEMVDFQSFYFRDSAEYEESLVERAHEFAAWGSRSEPYQGVAGFGMESQRDTVSRLTAMEWDEVDFQGKTVLDLGCNLGEFCREAAERGAKRVVGVDCSQVADLAYEFSNWLGYWNLDFLGLRLPYDRGEITAQSGIEKFDVVLALSVEQLKPLPWVFDLCGQVFYLEGHVPQHESTYRERLEQEFDRVEFLGTTRDHGPRPLFRCYRR